MINYNKISLLINMICHITSVTLLVPLPKKKIVIKFLQIAIMLKNMNPIIRKILDKTFKK